MKLQNKNVKDILGFYKDISLLGKIDALLGWDMNVNLPSNAGSGRAEQIAYLTKLISDKWLDKSFRKLVEETSEKGLTNEEKSILRNIKWAGKYYFQVPQKTIIKMAQTTSHSFVAWQKAREKNDFKMFSKYLEEVVNLNIEIAGYLGFEGNIYDALLDRYEPGLTSKKVSAVFETLTPNLVSLLEKIKSSKKYKQSKIKDSVYEKDVQETVSLFVLEKIGYDFGAGRQDVSAHPFTQTVGTKDVRITNRYKKDSFIESIMVAMHEGGHALYEQGVKDEYSETPLEGGVSLGIHESQSRFWENQIGRSLEFAKYLLPYLKKHYSALKAITPEDFYFALNDVRPQFIRVEADEVTYNLHISLRYEIERDLINGKIKTKDLPEIWNQKMHDYLGITPKNDNDGVLQDVHWSYGSFGYFPTYTLGNLYSAQIARIMNKELGIENLVETGEFKPILEWLRKNVHQYGSLYWPDELIKKITGEELNPLYFISYLKDKYESLYKLS